MSSALGLRRVHQAARRIGSRALGRQRLRLQSKWPFITASGLAGSFRPRRRAQRSAANCLASGRSSTATPRETTAAPPASEAIQATGPGGLGQSSTARAAGRPSSLSRPRQRQSQRMPRNEIGRAISGALGTIQTACGQPATPLAIKLRSLMPNPATARAQPPIPKQSSSAPAARKGMIRKVDSGSIRRFEGTP